MALTLIQNVSSVVYLKDCPVSPCPTCDYPGLWVQPMLDLEDRWIGADPNHPNNGMPCSMLDACIM